MSVYANLVGYLAMSLSIGSYLMRSHRSLTFTAAAGVVAWAAHFALQAAWTPAAVCVVMALRVVAGAYVVHWGQAARWGATVVGWGMTAFAASLTWAGAVSAPSTVASMFLVWAGFHLHYKPLRLALLLGEALWLLNGLVVGSLPAVLTAVLCIFLNGTVLLKERRAASPSGATAAP